MNNYVYQVFMWSVDANSPGGFGRNAQHELDKR